MAMHNYQLKIGLKRSKPKIWRRVIVPTNLLLSDLHKVLQTAMGWENAHLHQFIKGEKYYSLRLADDDFWDDHLNVDYTGQTVSDLLVKERDRIVYEYDFGDGWEHDVLLEKVLDEDKGLVLPVCLGGKMSCPPEDIGGVWGYEQMLEIMKQPGGCESFTAGRGLRMSRIILNLCNYCTSSFFIQSFIHQIKLPRISR